MHLHAKQVLGLMQELREEIRSRSQIGFDWRISFDTLRPQHQLLWKSLSTQEKRRFLRHVRIYWDIHRHRVAPEVGKVLQSLRERGQLEVHAGRILSYSADPSIQNSLDPITIHFRSRKNESIETLRTSYVINCTGPQGNYNQLRNPLIENLKSQGLLVSNPIGFGISTHENGNLIDSTGNIVDRLYTLGPPRSGDLWECTAVPEIRVQAERLARRLLESVES
jgi:uncharacterized NAD(P)/FAD-binding protein YdhS